MGRKRWIAVAGIGLAIVLVTACAGLLLLSQSVPGVARLLRGDPATNTALLGDAGEAAFTPAVSIATLTPTAEPTPSPTPPPTDTAPPTPTSTKRGEPPTAAASATPNATPSATATATPSTTPTATLPPPTATPRPQWLAFETRRGETGDYEIFAVTPKGNRLTNLSNSWADDLAPVWAPDGRHIAFVSLRDTLSGKWGIGKSSIYIMAFDPATGRGGEVVRVTDSGGSDGWPTWSPDGQRLAFHSDRSDGLDIWVINVDGTGLTRLTQHPAHDRYAAWSPDGQRIAYTSNRSGNEEVWVVNVAEALGGAGDSAAVNLTKSPGRDRYPMWSADGSRLTLNTKRDGDYEVYVMNADGSEQQNVSRSPDTTEGLADWSPDGRSLVLYSDKEGNKDIFVLTLATGQWFNVTRNPASDEFCTWSP